MKSADRRSVRRGESMSWYLFSVLVSSCEIDEATKKLLSHKHSEQDKKVGKCEIVSSRHSSRTGQEV